MYAKNVPRIYKKIYITFLYIMSVSKNNQKPSDALSQKQVHGIRLLHNKYFFG